MASDAFVACRGTRWLVRSLYFPVFLQIRNLPSRSHDLKHTHTSILPAAHSCARVLQLCFTHPKSRGGRSAEKRSGACEAPVGRALGASQDARERAYDAARQALARRLASHNAGRSPLGAPPWRLSPPLIPAQAGIQKLGPRFRGDERKRLTPLPAPPSGSSPGDAPQ
jgi:hypothetical protein